MNVSSTFGIARGFFRGKREKANSYQAKVRKKEKDRTPHLDTP